MCWGLGVWGVDGWTDEQAQANLPLQLLRSWGHNNALMYKFFPYKLNLYPFYHLTFQCDIDLQPTYINVLNGTSPSRRQQLCKIILKSMHKCTNYCPDKLNL